MLEALAFNEFGPTNAKPVNFADDGVAGEGDAVFLVEFLSDKTRAFMFLRPHQAQVVNDAKLIPWTDLAEHHFPPK